MRKQVKFPLCTLAETPRTAALCIEYALLIKWDEVIYKLLYFSLRIVNVRPFWNFQYLSFRFIVEKLLIQIILNT